MTEPNHKAKLLGPNNLGVDIVEMGGVEDTRVRPLSEVIRELREQAEKDAEQEASVPKGNGEPGGS
jgi:hypothetical protein